MNVKVRRRKTAQEALADFKRYYLPEVEKLDPEHPDCCPSKGTDFCEGLCDHYCDCFPAPKILFNRARCRKCGTFLESKHVHDMQTCACGAVSIDGGLEYIRQLAVDLNDIEDLTEYAP